MLKDAPFLAITGFITIAVGLVILLLGYLTAKNKNYRRHKYLMIVAVFVLLSFLVQYIFRAVILREETKFEGSDWMRDFVFIPVLVIHISFAIITLGLIFIHLRNTYRNQEVTKNGVPVFSKNYRPDHHKLGKRTLLLWLFSYIGGIIIFILLYLI